MNDAKIVEEKEILNMTEKEILDFVFSLNENEEIIINDKYIKKVITKDE